VPDDDDDSNIVSDNIEGCALNGRVRFVIKVAKLVLMGSRASGTDREGRQRRIR